tara:strand:- start:325 stop:492 length:168 start_codon:yes stop_codon:yes gene_type:complete
MTDKTIKVYIQGGCLLDVTNLPPDYNYELIDYDNQQAQEEELMNIVAEKVEEQNK